MMRTSLLFPALVLALAGVMFCPARVSAQAGEGGGGGRLSFLSADDRAHFIKVYMEVLKTHPELKAEQESMTKEREFVKNKGADATAEDRKTMRENFLAHHEKMDAAMKEADPTIAPVLDQVNAKMKERFAQRAGQGADAGSGDSGGATNQ